MNQSASIVVFVLTSATGLAVESSSFNGRL